MSDEDEGEGVEGGGRVVWGCGGILAVRGWKLQRQTKEIKVNDWVPGGSI